MWVYRKRCQDIKGANPPATVLVYEVGFFLPHGEWECAWTYRFDPDGECRSQRMVSFLNGGGDGTGHPP